MNTIKKDDKYNQLLSKIDKAYFKTKQNAIQAINFELISAYWNIGKYIIEYEQKGNIKAGYGDKLIIQLSRDLKLKHGKGFSKSNYETILCKISKN